MKLALQPPLPATEMRINAAVSGFLPLCFLIYLELSSRDGRRGSRWLSVTDGILSVTRDKVRRKRDQEKAQAPCESVQGELRGQDVLFH